MNRKWDQQKVHMLPMGNARECSLHGTYSPSSP